MGMTMPELMRTHACRCQCTIPETSADGVALQTDSPSVEPVLRRAFTESADAPGVFLAAGEGFVAQIAEALEPLSLMERRSVRAVPIIAGGEFDPWAAAPVDTLLRRLDTPWLPSLLNDEAFTFHLQPIAAADALGVHGFEALVRAGDSHHSRSPFDMIEAAKAHNALLKFDQVARKHAILQGFPKLADDELLFVNFLPMTIYDPKVCLRTTMDAASSIGADLSRIVFEVVESEQFPDIQHLRSILDAYREAGARVALDDLGSGNTAINYIDELNPDYIKIDKQIVTNAIRDRSPGLLQGLVRHAQHRNIRIIAEGVETLEQLELMRSLEVDFVQGWLLAKPSVEPVRTFNLEGRRAA